MKTYKAYCFDLDGTVYKGSTIIEEAKILIEHLRSKGIEPYYVTNNAKMTQQQVREKLAKMGLVVPEAHIMTSAIATAKYLATHFNGKKAFVVGDDGLHAALKDEGIQIIDEGKADVVVQGLNAKLSYQLLEEACYQIQNGAAFIGTNPDIKLPKERGFAPGNGSFVELIHIVTGVKPTYIGKPYSPMLEIIQKEHNFTKEDMLMIGDNYDTDILAGIDFGIDTLHVNTGVTRTIDVLAKTKVPTYTVATLAELYKQV